MAGSIGVKGQTPEAGSALARQDKRAIGGKVSSGRFIRAPIASARN
jgi:hypothetical protein